MNISCRKYHVILNVSFFCFCFFTLRYQYKQIMEGFPHFKEMEPCSYFLAEMGIVGGCL